MVENAIALVDAKLSGLRLAWLAQPEPLRAKTFDLINDALDRRLELMRERDQTCS